MILLRHSAVSISLMPQDISLINDISSKWERVLRLGDIILDSTMTFIASNADSVYDAL